MRARRAAVAVVRSGRAGNGNSTNPGRLQCREERVPLAVVQGKGRFARSATVQSHPVERSLQTSDAKSGSDRGIWRDHPQLQCPGCRVVTGVEEAGDIGAFLRVDITQGNDASACAEAKRGVQEVR